MVIRRLGHSWKRGLALLAPVAAALLLSFGAAARAGDSLPARLSDKEFWQLVSGFSEASGYFQSDNLVSNERQYQAVVPALQKLKRGGVYLGVAPDQNFTYILGVDPKIAFIVDIRRGNLHTQLMYKALVELSKDRAEFLSRLFSRARPKDAGPATSARDLFAAYQAVPMSDALFKENLQAIDTLLVKTHGFALTDEDLKGIEYVYGMFTSFGPDLTYTSSSNSGFRGGGGGRGGRMPTYGELQSATDADGRSRSYLGTEENFLAFKSFEARNLLVPVVGDFAGPKALRSVGQYLASHGATVTVFYVSNVEQYFFQNGVAAAFYANVATLPLDDETAFLRSARGFDVLDPIRGFLKDFNEGHIVSWQDVTPRGGHD